MIWRRTVWIAALILLVGTAGVAQGQTTADLQAQLSSILNKIVELQARLASWSGEVLSGNSGQGYDVVVVGAGTGGTSAAIQAARMGSRVALLEETDWIGGQMTAAAVTSIDVGATPGSETGLYSEFKSRLVEHYQDEGRSVSTCYFSDKTTCFEPRVGRDILAAMLEEAGVDVFLRERVVAVTKSGNVVTGVTTAKGKTFNSEVVIDATEHGDIIPLAGARYRTGNSTSGAVQNNSCIQDLTYTAVLKKYPNGAPFELMVRTPPPGYPAVKEVFRTFVAKEGLSRWSGAYPVSWPLHNAYRGMPDSSNPSSYTGKESAKITKTGVNWANDYPGHRIIQGSDGKGVADWLDQLSVSYLENPSERKRLNCEAKLKTLQFIYYVQKELGETSWSVSNEEGFDTPYNMEENLCANIPVEYKEIEKHLPVMPYVRESRRIIGVDTLTGAEMMRTGSPSRAATNFENSLAVGNYPNDLHNCSADADLESDLDETRQHISKAGMFQIPFGTFIPESVDGFVAAEKNISVSRLANGATRLQPVTMATGQAAGVIAHLAAARNVPPRRIDPFSAQKALLEAKSALSLYHFSDVSPDDPFWKDVQMASLYGVLAGYPDGSFGVGDALSREQMAVVLVSLFDIPLDPVPQTATFSDVAPGRWSYRFVEAIAREGFTAGCATDPARFCPREPVTKAQSAVFLSLGMELDTNGSANSQPLFRDVPGSHPAFKFIQAAAKAGVISGCSQTRFCPGQDVLREDVAGYISRVLDDRF